VTERRPRGRPKGYVVSDETKKKISRTRREKMKTGGRPLPPGEADVERRSRVYDRDGGKCVGCDAPYILVVKGRQRVNTSENIVVYRLEHGTPDDDASYVTLCLFCRENLLAGVRTVADVR
jgi:hypothetical protein